MRSGEPTVGSEMVEALLEENRQLREALESRIRIEQAKGILAERLELDVDEAFALLRYAARSNRIGIHGLAVRVLPSEPTPLEIVAAMSRWQRLRAVASREHTEAEREENRVRRERIEALFGRARKSDRDSGGP